MRLVPWETFQGEPSPIVNLRQRTRAMTNPSQPHVLFPGRRPSTVHTSDIYFVPPSKNIHTATSSSTSHRHPPLPPTSSTAFSNPFHRSLTCPPPIPPKPVELQQERPSADIVTIPETDPRAGPIEEDELAIAVALSQSESSQQQSVWQKLSSQEEDDLARALAESLKATGSLPPTPGAVHPSDIILPIPESTTPTQSSSPNHAATPTPNSSRLVMTDITPVDDPCANDEAIARRLAEEERSPSKPLNNKARLTDEHVMHISPNRSQSVPAIFSFIPNDERYGRQLAEPEAGTNRTRSKSALAVVGLRSSDLPPPYEVSLPNAAAESNKTSDSDFLSSSSISGNGSSGSHLSSQSISGSEIASTQLSNTLPSLNVTAPDQSASEPYQPPRLADRSVSSTSISSSLTSPATEWVFEDSPSSGAINPYVTDELLKGICKSSTCQTLIKANVNQQLVSILLL